MLITTFFIHKKRTQDIFHFANFYMNLFKAIRKGLKNRYPEFKKFARL